VTAAARACATWPLAATCQEFGLCEGIRPRVSRWLPGPDAAVAAQISALPDRDVRQFLAELADGAPRMRPVRR
jgi:hypothetical protein